MNDFALVYYSRAAYPFQKEELLTLAKRASDRNHRFKITGSLQYRNGYFFSTWKVASIQYFL